MKRIFSSILIYFLLFGGTASIICGYYVLSIKEIDLYSEIIGKSKFYVIETFTGENFFTESLAIKEMDKEIYILFDGKKLPVSEVKSVNSKDINGEFVKKVSRNGTMGIILAAVGGLSVIISLILKDYI